MTGYKVASGTTRFLDTLFDDAGDNPLTESRSNNANLVAGRDGRDQQAGEGSYGKF